MDESRRAVIERLREIADRLESDDDGDEEHEVEMPAVCLVIKDSEHHEALVDLGDSQMVDLLGAVHVAATAISNSIIGAEGGVLLYTSPDDDEGGRPN